MASRVILDGSGERWFVTGSYNAFGAGEHSAVSTPTPFLRFTHELTGHELFNGARALPDDLPDAELLEILEEAQRLDAWGEPD